MASTTYIEIVQRLDGLEGSELWLLLSDIQARISSRPKRPLKDFEPTGKLDRPHENWVKKLRSEWDDV